MTTRILGVLFFIFSIPLRVHAAWPADYPDALSRARTERKLILAALDKQTDTLHDAFLRETEGYPAMLQAYGSFVRVRVIARLDGTVPEVAHFLTQGPPMPSFAIVDPGGTYVTSWSWADAPSSYLNFLNLVRGEAEAILDAADLRASGRVAEADVLLAESNLRIRNYPRSHDFFERAVAGFKARSDNANVEKSLIGVYVTDYMKGSKWIALPSLRKIAAKSSDPSIGALAHLAIAHLYEAGRNPREARVAYRNALDRAVEGSPEWNAAREALLRLGDEHVPPALKSDATLSIVMPRRASLTGIQDFIAAGDPSVSRVEWYLDGARVPSSTDRPFRLNVDLGATPRAHELEAVAYDAKGKALARAIAPINDRLDEPRIYLVSPATDNFSGRVDIEADAYVPPGHAIRSVEFFWNDSLIRRFEQPPYRVSFDVPPAFGSLRAVITLDDGTMVEDARIAHGDAYAATVDVHEIVFPATVTDARGKRIDGLTSADFAAFDGSTKIDLKVRDVPAEGVTLGLVLDLSASMTNVLLSTIDFSSRLVDSVVRPEDRMLLITFDRRPRLLQGATNDRALLQSRLHALTATGDTALADALAFSMQQFNGLAGKRAIVLVTDGNEVSSEQRAVACMQLAKEIGVPMYVFVPHDAVASGGVAFRRMLSEMAGVTGGLFFDHPNDEAVPAIVERIRDEVRGQYLLSFSSQQSGRGWRALRVTVPGKAATVRTVSGYEAR